jgi:hypothetical protein
MRYAKGSTQAKLQHFVCLQAMVQCAQGDCCACSLFQTEPGTHVTSNAAVAHLLRLMLNQQPLSNIRTPSQRLCWMSTSLLT